MKLKFKKPEIGEVDKIIIDEDGNRVAALLRNANGWGYIICPFLKIKNYIPIEVGTAYQAIYLVKKLFKDSGYSNVEVA